MSLQDEEAVRNALLALGRGMRAARERTQGSFPPSGRARDEPGDGDEQPRARDGGEEPRRGPRRLPKGNSKKK